MGGIAAIDITEALVSSAVVAAIVGGLSSFLTQRYCNERKAQEDYEFTARKRLVVFFLARLRRRPYD
jgi:uncharacterized membrane-anchored protein